MAAISGNWVCKLMGIRYVENEEGRKEYFEAGTALRILIQQDMKKKVPLVENRVLKREYALTTACCCCFRNSGNAIQGIFCVFFP